MASSGSERAARSRMIALFTVLGGTVWVTHSLVLATRPEGCIAASCSVAAGHRVTEDVAWLLLLSVAFLAVATGVLAGDLSRHARTTARTMWAAAAFLSAGAVALAAGVVINAAIVGDSPLWWLHDSDSLGRFLPVVGSALAGVAVVRARALRAWAGAALIIGSVLTLGFNAQNARVLLTIPLGLAWVATGVEAGRSHTTEAPDGQLAPGRTTATR